MRTFTIFWLTFALTACSSSPKQTRLERPERLNAKTMTDAEYSVLVDEIDRGVYDLKNYILVARPIGRYGQEEVPAAKDRLCFILDLRGWSPEQIELSQWDVELQTASKLITTFQETPTTLKLSRAETPSEVGHRWRFPHQRGTVICSTEPAEFETPMELRIRYIPNPSWKKAIFIW